MFKLLSNVALPLAILFDILLPVPFVTYKRHQLELFAFF